VGRGSFHDAQSDVMEGRVIDRRASALPEFFSDRGLRMREMSLQHWGQERVIELIGRSPAFSDFLKQLEKVGPFREAVLITGESGVGKEQIAQAVHLLGQRTAKPYVTVNCPQFQEGNLTVSELFGHKKGSFTGAVGDHAGAFEQADGGTIFLDEVADLHPTAQAMLLRALAMGEFKPLGATRPRSADVRVVAATNRPLNQMMQSGEFRHDLFFRLRHFHLDVPSLRARGEDWRLILEYVLRRLGQKYGVAKRLSTASDKLLSAYPWPGNVRQLIGVVTTGYAMSESTLIEPQDFATQLEGYDNPHTSKEAPAVDLFQELVSSGGNFWDVIYRAFMERDLNRAQLRAFVKNGLRAAEGNYRRLLELLRLPESDYQRFMDFLRHHDLKP
jgi:two-component system, NtrC family, response regulator